MSGPITVAPAVALRLGGAGEILEQLWPVRCQTCGHDLTAPQSQPATPRPGADPQDQSQHRPEDQPEDRPGGRPGHGVELVVEDADKFAVASLHHRGCRPSAWEPAPAGLSPWTGPHATCRTRAVLLPLTGSGLAPLTPTLLVNPSMERVVLGNDDGRRFVTLARFQLLGMRAPGSEKVPRQPLPNSQAALSGHRLNISLDTPNRDAYSVELSDPVKEAFQAQERLLVGITHALDPHAVRDAGQVASTLLAGRVLCGWVQADRPRLTPHDAA